MTSPAKHDLWALTEKEKQTLRLVVRGHDAKSIARSLGLSVHTINERLRDARRKMAVSSSREAARILLDAEGNDLATATPDLLGNTVIGEDATDPRDDHGNGPIGARRNGHRLLVIIGVFLMTFALGLLMLAAVPQVGSAPPPETAVAATARQWLGLLDQARWEESYRETGAAFRKLNTARIWAAASVKARVPLGEMISRTFVGQENLPAPPAGYEVTKFRTRFTNRAEAVETVTLDREDGHWRVVGVTIE